MKTDLIEAFMDRVDEIEKRRGKPPKVMYLFETEYRALWKQVQEIAERKSEAQLVAYIYMGKMIIADVHVKVYRVNDNLPKETKDAFESLRNPRHPPKRD